MPHRIRLSLLALLLAVAVTAAAPAAAVAACPCTIWPSSTTPGDPAAPDNSAVNLGVKFRSDQAGYITGVRFFKGSGNTGTHVGSLWSANGSLLAWATFTNETASGWQQVNFAAPVPIKASTTYVASYHTDTGFYAFDGGYFASAGVDNPPLHALRDGVDRGNGVYRYGGTSVAFPSATFKSANYWVDVVFDQTANDTTPPQVAARMPASGATGVAVASPVAAAFDEPVQSGTISMSLTGPSGAVAGTTGYDSNSRTATFTPGSSLAHSATYTATVSGARDMAGNTMAPISWQFTTSKRGSVTFPVGVWDQTPELNAQNYANIGITQFVGLYNGPLSTSLAALSAAHLHVVTGGQVPWVLADANAAVISAWLQPDEPDNAQPDGHGGYGPCIAPSLIQQNYRAFKQNDPTRPVVLGLGRGVADVNWVGRGSCTGQTSMYRQYAQGADILAFDVYPVNEGYPIDIIATGVDNLRSWGGGKPVWFDVETTDIGGTAGPTRQQTKAETWLAIIHGAQGITYFCHIFTPSFVEAGCLSNPRMAAALAAQNRQIQSLANVLLTPSVTSLTVSSSVRVDATAKRAGISTYVFAVDPEPGSTAATFTVSRTTSGTVTVLGEGRTLPLSGGTYTDHFAGYGTHLYEVTP